MKVLFASQNVNKVKEISKLLPEHIEIIGLKDIGFTEDIPETAPTLEGNAVMKAKYLADKLDYPIFADDTGLEIEALNGEPGVYSARYAGEDKNAEKNMDLVLNNLKGITNRNAKFRTVISLEINGENHCFEGKVEGQICQERSGADGFGYDPIFKPNGYNQTFAEMSMEDKNKISHRGLAVSKLIKFLKAY